MWGQFFRRRRVRYCAAVTSNHPAIPTNSTACRTRVTSHRARPRTTRPLCLTTDFKRRRSRKSESLPTPGVQPAGSGVRRHSLFVHPDTGQQLFSCVKPCSRSEPARDLTGAVDSRIHLRLPTPVTAFTSLRTSANKDRQQTRSQDKTADRTLCLHTVSSLVQWCDTPDRSGPSAGPDKSVLLFRRHVQ